MLAERKYDPTFYPVIYGLPDGADWKDEQNWYRANPSLRITVPIERVREAFRKLLPQPQRTENQFKQLRLRICGFPHSPAGFRMRSFARETLPLTEEALLGSGMLQAGLDLSYYFGHHRLCTGLSAAVGGRTLHRAALIFGCRRKPYRYGLPVTMSPMTAGNNRDTCKPRKAMLSTTGTSNGSLMLGYKFHIKEIAYDRWGAVQMVQNLEGLGFTVIPFGQGFRDMSPPSKEFYMPPLEGNIQHGGNPILRWMAGNVVTLKRPCPEYQARQGKINGKN